MLQQRVQIIGGGLAGCEAALQLASAGVAVDLYEMRPYTGTPAHRTGKLAELVCSNSFKGTGLNSAHGLFKRELHLLGSHLIRSALFARVPAGQSLAVDRDLFAAEIETAVKDNALINLHREEVCELDPDRTVIVATGPLSSDSICSALFELLGESRLFFFDSIAPVVEADSIDYNKAYLKNRWDKGTGNDFLNCPLDKDQYLKFVEALKNADTAEEKPFEKGELFEGCLPIEEMAKRGTDTLRFGPMRPVGLSVPSSGERPYAVLQLRTENRDKTLYNLVGCQTRLKQASQRAVFSLVPGLHKAEYARYGAMHRNTFINSPAALQQGLNLKGTGIYFAGQITGAEGYTEAIGTGLFAATMAYCSLHGITGFSWPAESCIGALTRYLTQPNPGFQPMNLNFGLFPRPEGIKKSEKKKIIVERCLNALDNFALPWS